MANRSAGSWEPNLAVDLNGFHIINPITVASGTFGYGQEFGPYCDLTAISAICVKGLTLAPRAGHPQPRLVETPSGMLNCIGLQNVGVKEFIEDKLPFLRTIASKVIANINGSSVDDYRELASILSGVEGIHALEVNVSCPNVKQGGMAFGVDPMMVRTVTESVRLCTRLPVIVKLSPNVTDIRVMARAAEDGGAHILSLVNTLLGMAIDVETRKPLLSNIVGGLSGPAIKPVALRCVWEAARAVKIPIIGMGGITTGSDALEFLLAGASAVSIGTANFLYPDAAPRILEEIREYCIHHSIRDISELTGGMRLDEN